MSVPRLKRMKDAPIQCLAAPGRARIPANGLIPVVTTGDRVAAGDLVLTSRADSALQYRRHATLTGIVTAIGPDLVIEGELGEVRPLDIAPASIVETVREAGIVGMGGGGFPTYAKLDVPDGGIDTVLVNACESEPYVTCDRRVLIEQRAGVENGLRLARQALRAERGIVIGSDATYPGGDERILVERILGRKIPPFKRPVDVGAIVLNTQTTFAIHRAVVEGRPLVDRVITVDGGAVGRPGNYLVPIGTEIGHILNACETDFLSVEVVLCGGPMMGVRAQLETPVTAGTIAVLALAEDEISRPVDGPCIRCGQCLAVCPYGLAPGKLLRSPSPAVLRCVGCGACEFVCPSRRALVAHLRDLKRQYQDGSGALVR